MPGSAEQPRVHAPVLAGVVQLSEITVPRTEAATELRACAADRAKYGSAVRRSTARDTRSPPCPLPRGACGCASGSGDCFVVAFAFAARACRRATPAGIAAIIAGLPTIVMLLPRSPSLFRAHNLSTGATVQRPGQPWRAIHAAGIRRASSASGCATQPGAAYLGQSGFSPQPGVSAQPGYPPQPGAPGHPPQPWSSTQPGHPAQSGTVNPAPQNGYRLKRPHRSLDTRHSAGIRQARAASKASRHSP
ncbi:hypothetical protein SAMN05421854_1011610 [Amycolatopsis rubida]|uniref:Uncharacterized protein n=1 Tax=Amycolatopsis rubida TaxID=112413 RepID=A0A1I5GHE2_9PSEU|nr:hypothetical protein SAMN05421854_1011610 [Amycolatopsis rubida]